MSDRKNYQVYMKPGAHRQLKKRAKELGAPIGLFIENMFATLESTLQEEIRFVESNGSQVSEADISEIILAIWAASESTSDHVRKVSSHIKSRLAEKEIMTAESVWKPKVTLGIKSRPIAGEAVKV